MVNYIVKSKKRAGDSKIFVVALARQAATRRSGAGLHFGHGATRLFCRCPPAAANTSAFAAAQLGSRFAN